MNLQIAASHISFSVRYHYPHSQLTDLTTICSINITMSKKRANDADYGNPPETLTKKNITIPFGPDRIAASPDVWLHCSSSNLHTIGDGNDFILFLRTSFDLSTLYIQPSWVIRNRCWWTDIRWLAMTATPSGQSSAVTWACCSPLRVRSLSASPDTPRSQATRRVSDSSLKCRNRAFSRLNSSFCGINVILIHNIVTCCGFSKIGLCTDVASQKIMVWREISTIWR